MNSFNSQEAVSSSGGGGGAQSQLQGNQFVSEAAGVDEEGFSVPPRGYDRPIGLEDSTRSAEGGRNLLDDDEDDDNEPLRNDS